MTTPTSDRSPYAGPMTPPPGAHPPMATPGLETRQVLLVLGAACLVAALATGTALVWWALGVTGQAAVMVGVTATLLVTAVRLKRLPATAEALCAVGVAGVLIDAVAGRSLGLAGVRELPFHVYAGLASTFVAVLLASMSVGVRRFWSPPVGAAIATVTAVIAWVQPTSIDRIAWLGPAVLAAAAALDVVLRQAGRVAAAGRVVTASLVSVLGTISVGAALFATTRHSGGLGAGLVMAVAVFVLPEFLRDRSRDAAVAAAATSGVLLGALTVASWFDAAADVRAAIVVTSAAVVAVVAALPMRGLALRLQVAVSVTGAATMLGLYDSLTDRSTTFAFTNLALSGIAAAVAVGWPRRRVDHLFVRGASAVAAVVLATVGATLQLQIAHATTPELYVATPGLGAILLGTAAIAVWPRTSSWVLAPGIVTMLLPTLLLALGHDTVRQVAILAAGAALVIIGSQLRMAAPLALGAGAMSLVVLRVAGPQLGRLPHWVALGVIGAVLLALGATWESRMLDVRRAAHALRPRIAALR